MGPESFIIHEQETLVIAEIFLRGQLPRPLSKADIGKSAGAFLWCLKRFSAVFIHLSRSVSHQECVSFGLISHYGYDAACLRAHENML